MKPVKFEQANRCLTAPVGNPDVLPLYVYTDGRQCISAWELSDEEIDMLVKSKRLYVSVLSGQTQPPILLMVKSPFSDNSDSVLIIAGPDGVTVNGKQMFSTAQVDNESYKNAWGSKSILSTWLARRILTISVGHGVVPEALDSAFRELFLDPQKQGEPFQLMVNVIKFVNDYSEGKTQPAQAYLYTSL